MTQTAAVAVLVAAYDLVVILGGTIDRIVQQRFKNYELIVGGRHGRSDFLRERGSFQVARIGGRPQLIFTANNVLISDNANAPE